MTTNCEKCIHKRVCNTKNQKDYLNVIREMDKLKYTISDNFEFTVRCKEFREDVAVRTPFGK